MTERINALDLVKQSLEGIVYELLDKKDLPREHLVDMAFYRFVYDVGGLQIYIARNSAVKQRDDLIRKEFTGNNVHELSRKYNLSFVKIYEILRDKE